ncbi:MAG TPA: DUF2130 domain-containing protein [Pirellulales bacterium]
MAEQLQKERQRIADEALHRAKAQVATELDDVRKQLTDSDAKLKEAQQAELELRKQRRELQEERETLELTLARRLDEERGKIRDKAKREALEERQLKEAEKEKLIGDLRSQIEELKRKSEEGSQQSQGEILELELEALLRHHFPYDTIVPVPKGVHGGDVLQIIHDKSGVECGIILWESKRTKNWSDSWLPKLRDDQRAAKAQLAVLVSIELPENVMTFNHIDGIWVTSRACAVGLAGALRAGLIEVAAAKRAMDGRNDKMELLYSYLSSSEFRHRVEGIVEAFATLRADLEAEKRSVQRMWAKREKQIERAVTCTTGMYGDLSGIIGRSLPKIEMLELPLLEEVDTAPDGDDA